MKIYLELLWKKFLIVVKRIENIKIRLLLPFLINTFDITLPEGSEKLVQYSFGVLILSLITLICFIQILFYFIVINLSNNKILLDKLSQYPILLKIFNLYKQTRFAYLL